MTRPHAELADGIVRVDWPDTGERVLLDLDETTALHDAVARLAATYTLDQAPAGDGLRRTIPVRLARPGRDPYTADLTADELAALDVELRAAHLGAAHRRRPAPSRLPYTDPET